MLITPGTTVRLPASMPSIAWRATSSDSIQVKPGSFEAASSAPAASSNSVLVKPGHSEVTDTPVPESSEWTASEKEWTKALLAA